MNKMTSMHAKSLRSSNQLWFKSCWWWDKVEIFLCFLWPLYRRDHHRSGREWRRLWRREWRASNRRRLLHRHRCRLLCRRGFYHRPSWHRLPQTTEEHKGKIVLDLCGLCLRKKGQFSCQIFCPHCLSVIVFIADCFLKIYYSLS